MMSDANLIIIEEPTGSEQLLNLYFCWLYAQTVYDTMNPRTADTMSHHRPSIFLMTFDPRDDCEASRGLLDYLFDFVYLSTEIYGYDGKLAVQQRAQES
ncbi:hypothetical protein SCP_1400340 [Sparassis crispa]|uniref:Uncharacterized protein n=1 Tax=Sparassis crispa TaxID=139825 RepID=A0A401H2L0_9APHY|nr:hypothetical protein SCP_1400340 [Sparassis crispa]GBE88629.1 hypothetical protein SCP_1400340 [Sparassis crispa]